MQVSHKISDELSAKGQLGVPVYFQGSSAGLNSQVPRDCHICNHYEVYLNTVSIEAAQL